jgi:hypothetical protein
MLDMNPDYFTIEQLKISGMWPQEHFSAYGMIPYIKRMKRESIIGIEVGVLKAENAYILLSECLNISKLYGIDNYKPHTDYETVRTQADMEQYERLAVENTKTFGERYVLIKDDSKNAVNKFDAESVDFILIDADHTKEGVKAHLTEYYPILKKNGLLFVHNFQMGLAQGLTEGVKEFRSENKIRTPLNKSKNFLGFWEKW